MTDQAETILDSISTILLNFYKMDMQPNKTFEKYNRVIFPNIFTKKNYNHNLELNGLRLASDFLTSDVHIIK